MADRFGDVLGTNLYEGYGGFSACVTMITLVYALIIPVLLLVPRELTTYSDGEVPDHETVPQNPNGEGWNEV